MKPDDPHTHTYGQSLPLIGFGRKVDINRDSHTECQYRKRPAVMAANLMPAVAEGLALDPEQLADGFRWGRSIAPRESHEPTSHIDPRSALRELLRSHTRSL